VTVHRPTSADDLRALKVTTQRTVRLCGGQDSAASITRVSRQQLSDYCNTENDRHRDTFVPADVMADLIVDCAERGEVAPLLETLCALAGGRFVPVRGDGALDLIDDILRAAMAARDRLEQGEGGE